MEEESLLDEAARLYALSRQSGGGSRRLYRTMALHCCLVATELRAARQFPEPTVRQARRRRRPRS